MTRCGARLLLDGPQGICLLPPGHPQPCHYSSVGTLLRELEQADSRTPRNADRRIAGALLAYAAGLVFGRLLVRLSLWMEAA